jgi:hypothetical protein
MVFVSTTMIGLIDKAIDICSRKDAENAKENEYNDTSLQKTHVTSALSSRKKHVKAGLSATP